ncbi:hypothetical protein BG011_007729 [Mortierella polycephala]|uniref:Uncharacterized protein n=1 Tax=Mortierella polycephala TaxID=41804 RepID=A0A9P6PPJ0_9FUNG|nr:hypothetical protein BG011_007729 [Mortierella polycephala]
MGATRRSTSSLMRPSIPKLIAAALALALSAALIIPVDSMPVSHIVSRAEPIDPATAAPSIALPVKANNSKRQNAAAKNEEEEGWTFDIKGPEPYDIWTSGTVATLSWMDTNLPPKTTFDIALIPVDPETNPKAIKMTRRPILRYIPTMSRFLDVIVPYDLITREQLLKEQEGEGGAPVEANENGHGTIPTNTTTMTTNQPTEISENDIQSQARLYITAYDGRTNKVLAQKSIFPIIIKKDHVLDWRTVPVLPLPSPPASPAPASPTAEEQEPEGSDELLAKKDSETTHLEDHVYKAEDINEDEGNNEDDPNNHTPNVNEEDAVEDEAEKEVDLNETTPTGLELGVNSDVNEGDSSETDSMDHQQKHEHNHDRGEGEGEGEDEDKDEDEDDHEHGHSHVIDPNHFQNEEDIDIWKQHEDDPGYNPPIKIEDAGTIQITRWINNKERFFVGAPYVFAWAFPQDAAQEGLTGEVNIYVEDAYTAKRYDIVAGAMSSDIRFMYLHPTKIMMSADPKKRIYLRARVELDLFKRGNIRRYTGFSKAFWVERGAL